MALSPGYDDACAPTTRNHLPRGIALENLSQILGVNNGGWLMLLRVYDRLGGVFFIFIFWVVCILDV